MRHFLRQVAKIFYQNEREKIGDYFFVFPNKRAGLFFKKYLSELVDQPIFAPQIFSINDFFLQYTSLKVEGKIPLLFRLYTIFKQWYSDESFDKFLPWGEMLLADFDDIQKYMVDAKQLFCNIVDIKEIDGQFVDFNAQQREQLRRFWEKLLPIDSAKAFTKDFVDRWETIYPIYETFNANLIKEGIGYEGLVFAEALNRLNTKNNEILAEKVVFIGFNALNEQERALMHFFKTQGNADFYWDKQSDSWGSATEAYNFVKENAKIFPSCYELKTTIEELACLDIISLSSAVGQAKCVHDILTGLQQKRDKNDVEWLQNTAVVLPDEKLLVPMLYSIPDSISSLNITMGYPLALSRTHTLLHKLFEMQQAVRNRENGIYAFYFKYVLPVLNHEDIRKLCPNVADYIKKINAEHHYWVENTFFENDESFVDIFRSVSSENLIEYFISIFRQIYIVLDDSEIEKESIVSYITMLNQLQNNITRFSLKLESETLMLLIDKVVNFSRIPFKGEPLRGLQVMGFLETRSLDFENVIITSMNDGVFPKRQTLSSVVPYNLRKAFGLPTFEEQERIWAYYFYRLLNRAKRVYLLYDDRVVNDTQTSGEMSQFIYQLKYLHNPKYLCEKSVVYDINFSRVDNSIQVDKTDEIMSKIQLFATPTAKGGKALSPSALSDYLQCPLKFYLARIVNIKDNDDLVEGIKASVFGSIFHLAMELLYKGKKHINKETFVQMGAAIDKSVTAAFLQEYYKLTDTETTFSPSGRDELVMSVIKKYVQNTLEYDKTIAEFDIVDVERKTQCIFPIFDGKIQVNLHGIVDRIHLKNNLFYIVDYKTGKEKLVYETCEKIFDESGRKHSKAIFQTLMYALMLSHSDVDIDPKRMVPNVFLIKEIKKGFSPYLREGKGKGTNSKKLENYGEIASEFEPLFSKLLEEIFNRDIPFKQNAYTENCKNCIFKATCNKNDEKNNTAF